MKRQIQIVMVAVSLLALLSGCGSGGGTSNPQGGAGFSNSYGAYSNNEQLRQIEEQLRYVGVQIGASSREVYDPGSRSVQVMTLPVFERVPNLFRYSYASGLLQSYIQTGHWVLNGGMNMDYRASIETWSKMDSAQVILDQGGF